MDTRAVAKYKQQLYGIISDDEGMQAFQEVAPIVLPPSDKEKGVSQLELQCNRLIPLLFSAYNFIKILGVSPDDDTIYYKRASEYLYQPLQDNTLRELVIAIYNDIYHRRPSGDKIKTIGDTLKSWVENKTKGLDASIIQISPELFWDITASKFTDQPDRPCFRRLFDQIENDNMVVDIDQINPKHIQAMFKETTRLLEKNDGTLLPHELDNDASIILSYEANPLSPYWVWANGDPDTFNDLLKASATIFMKNKPKGAFILIGNTRNGKSSFLKLLHTMLGRHNTSALKLTNLNVPRLNLTMLTSMLNAPDEEDEGRSQQVLENQSFFKSIASHDPIQLEVMYSKKPQWVSTNFPSFYPMNDLPQWQGTGAEACMKRSLVIRFTNDLSKFDNNGHNFEKETYTAEFYSSLLGILLAFANYYSTREMTFSDTMAKSISDVSEEVDNLSTYIKLFRKHFDAFTTAALVWEDYKLWCEERDLHWSGKASLYKKLKFYNLRETRLSTPDGEELRRFQSFTKEEKIPMERRFCEDARIDAAGGATVEYLITSQEGALEKHPHHARSVISIMEERDE